MKPAADYTREELHDIACRTRDPDTLPLDVLLRMRDERVGPWVHSRAEWERALAPIKVKLE